MPQIKAEIKQRPSDFQVTELLQPSFTDEGEHAWLWVEKTGANTEWVARQLARFAGVSSRDVGYSGLKDRHAITRQWFSVRAQVSVDWSAAVIEGACILEQHRNRRKLKRGTHRGNRFRIALRGGALAGARDELETSLTRISAEGVPNHFGEQRFGQDGANLRLAEDWSTGIRLPRHKRSIAISAARSVIFNGILDERIADGSWNRIVAGELANLDGTGSVFPVDTADDVLLERCCNFDVHPTGTMWGTGAPRCAGALADLEQAVAGRHAELAAALEREGVAASSRPLRLVVRDLEWEFGDDVLWLGFELAKGGYATTVISQLADVSAVQSLRSRT